MKKQLLIVAVICIALLFGACAASEPMETDLGAFQYEQDFMPQIVDEAGNTYTAASGNTYLVVYLKPAQGVKVSLDEAQQYFFGGTSAALSGETYDMSFMVFEKVDNQYIRFGLVFEVKDYDYENAKEQPSVTLTLP